MSAGADTAGQDSPASAVVTARRGLVPPLLRDVVFRRYWSGSTISMVGDQVTTIAVPLTAGARAAGVSGDADGAERLRVA